jgi:hypothetical protein
MRAWLEILRISNLPTVWTNVLVGAVLSLAVARPSNPSLLAIPLAIIAGSCLYLAGMVFNDVFDVEIDRRERPGRPIPSGRVHRVAAASFGTVLLAIGIGLPWFHGVIAGSVATGIGLMLLAYDALHARTAWSVLLMGGCRGGLYVLGMACLNDPTGSSADDGLLLAVIVGGIAAIHVAAFSMVARDEVTEASRWKCPRCGYPIAEGSDTCTECGTACDAESIVAIATERLKKRRGWYGTGTMVLVTPFGFLAIVAAMIGMPTTGKRSEEWFLGAILISFVGIGAYLVNSTRHLAGHPNAVGRFVLRSIAVLTLFDAGVMAFFWVTSPDAEARFVAGLGVFAAIGCFFLVRWSHRRIAGT